MRETHYEPVVRWPGGKRRLTKYIVPLLPAHACYVEPFGGGLAVLAAKPRSRAEVVNDIDGDLVRFYRVLRYHVDALLDELSLVLNSREEMLAYIGQPGLTDVQKAARWYMRNALSFGGLGEHFGTGKTGAGGASLSSRANRLAKLRQFNERLDKVSVENLPWQQVFDRYDASTTCFYVDPPYTSGHQYGRPWTADDHRALRDRLFSIAGAWVLSYDDSPEVRSLYEGCRFVEIVRARGIGNNHSHMRRDYAELLIVPADQPSGGQ